MESLAAVGVLAQAHPPTVINVGPILLGLVLFIELYIALKYKQPGPLIVTLGGVLIIWLTLKGLALMGAGEALAGAVLLLCAVFTGLAALPLLLRPWRHGKPTAQESPSEPQ